MQIDRQTRTGAHFTSRGSYEQTLGAPDRGTRPGVFWMLLCRPTPAFAKRSHSPDSGIPMKALASPAATQAGIFIEKTGPLRGTPCTSAVKVRATLSGVKGFSSEKCIFKQAPSFAEYHVRGLIAASPHRIRIGGRRSTSGRPTKDPRGIRSLRPGIVDCRAQQGPRAEAWHRLCLGPDADRLGAISRSKGC